MQPKLAIKIGVSIVVGFFLVFFLGFQCASAEDAPKTKHYDAQFVGTFNDWESISGDKVQDVGLGDDYVFLWSDAMPQAVVLVLNLGGWVVHSDTFMAPEYPETRTVEFFSTVDPNGNKWTIDSFNKTQGQVDDYQFFNEQSFKFYKQPVPLKSWTIISVGLRAVIQFGADLDQIQVRVLKLEKVLNYVN